MKDELIEVGKIQVFATPRLQACIAGIVEHGGSLIERVTETATDFVDGMIQHPVLFGYILIGYLVLQVTLHSTTHKFPTITSCISVIYYAATEHCLERHKHGRGEATFRHLTA